MLSSAQGQGKSNSRAGLVALLDNPSVLPSLDLAAWEEVLSQARSARLLPRLATLIEEAGLSSNIPVEIQPHLDAGKAVAAQHVRLIRSEMSRLERALGAVEAPVVLLKGSAYLAGGLPPSKGRLCSDIDILVPRERLSEVESALRQSGYRDLDVDPYDQRYYRAWMHEIPPLCHPDRTTPVDVHHNILPPTGRLHPRAEALFAASLPIGGSKFRVLAPADMVLHSAAHFFQDGDLAGGLRDLIDLDALLRHFSREAGFWRDLVPRAREMDLARPLFYALRYSTRILDTPVPDQVMRESAWEGPPRLLLGLMDSLVGTSLAIRTGAEAPLLAGIARWCLYVRSHWLRMPPILLARHLTRKAFKRWIERWEERKKDQDVQHARRDH